MGDTWKRMVAGLSARWKAMSQGQRAMTASLLVGVVATVVLSAVLARHAVYGVLYAGLDPEQANGVVEELRDRNISFRLKDAGRTILVPEGEIYATRLAMAGEGLPGGSGAGYEVFDRRGFGMTNFMQQVNYRRALEGELTRTIREMEEVLGARVHLVIPERSLFTDEERRPSASVMVRLKPGGRLSRKQIEGVAYLVAGSVEGLTAERVNVLDFHGNLLSTHAEDGGLDSQGVARLEMKTTVERWLEEKAQTMLDRVVGPGKSVVRVTAELDFEQLERDVEMFDGENPVVRSEELTEESQGEEGGESRNTITNYEINRTVERLVKAPGTIERLTVAVTVDGHYGQAEGQEEPQFVSRSEAELQQLAAIVRNAVGISEPRGDSFHIACVQFDHSLLEEERNAVKRVERQMLWQTLLGKGLWLAGAAAVFLILRKFFRSLAHTLSEVGRAPTVRSGGRPSDLSAAEIAEVGSVADRVTEVARRQPEQSAALIRNMLEESG